MNDSMPFERKIKQTTTKMPLEPKTIVRRDLQQTLSQKPSGTVNFQQKKGASVSDWTRLD